MTNNPSANRLTVFASFSGQGGVERMLVNLLGGLVVAGVDVDLLLARAEGPFVAQIPASVNITRLRAGHTAWCVPELAAYLVRHKPPVLLAIKDRAIRAAARACRLAHSETRLVGRLGTNLGAALAHKPLAAAALRRLPMRRAYRRVDTVIAVSDGVARDTRALTGLGADRVVVVRNPVVTRALVEAAQQPTEWAWLDRPGVPVILGMGRLTAQKDFTTLIQAFAELVRHRDCRLLIAGDGPKHDELQALINELGLADIACLTGFVDNPAAMLARCDVFVLSSCWEGSPNVLTEALALGTPAVATDCPSGPREILADGEYGPLVPVGDAAALAIAMLDTLDAPKPADQLQHAVREHDVATSTARYIEVLRLHVDS